MNIWTGVIWTLHWHNFGDTWEILSHYLGLDMVATWGRPTRYSAYGQSLDRFSDKVRQQTHIQWKCKRTFVIFVQDFLKKHFCSGAVDVYFPSVGICGLIKEHERGSGQCKYLHLVQFPDQFQPDSSPLFNLWKKNSPLLWWARSQWAPYLALSYL